EFVTVIEGVCADGTALKPTIILKAEEFIAEWFKKVRGILEDKAGDEFWLLLFDGHSSHANITFLKFCISQKIIPYYLPLHTTHQLQPLDIYIFSTYKY
ncbi:hypothetical protein L873DRAFT_1778929, partial [Choiromyces venosus 120613-1]